MRVKNKEIRRRRHRKDVKIKDAARALREQYGDKKVSTGAATAVKAKAPAKKAKKAE